MKDKKMTVSIASFKQKLRIRYTGKKVQITPIEKLECEQKCVVPAQTISVTGPQFLNDDIELPQVVEKFNIDIPSVEVRKIQDAMPMAGSSFIIKDKKAYIHNLYNIKRDVCMAERFGSIVIDDEKKILRYKNNCPSVKFYRGISLLGQVDGNYAHFLTESLPKLVLLDEMGVHPYVPLFVERMMHKNHYKLLKFFNVRKREVIRVGQGQPAFPHELVDISPVSYAPPEYRTWLTQGILDDVPPEVFKFNPTAMDTMRQRVIDSKLQDSPYGEKLFIFRKSPPYGNGRILENMKKLAKIAINHGFDIIEPGSMGALKQMSAFKNAKVIVSPVGAALSNLLFTPKGCKVLCMTPLYEGANHYYFSNFANVLGHDLHYLLGRQTSHEGHILHRNYKINKNKFEEVIKKI